MQDRYRCTITSKDQTGQETAAVRMFVAFKLGLEVAEMTRSTSRRRGLSSAYFHAEARPQLDQQHCLAGWGPCTLLTSRHTLGQMCQIMLHVRIVILFVNALEQTKFPKLIHRAAYVVIHLHISLSESPTESDPRLAITNRIFPKVSNLSNQRKNSSWTGVNRATSKA